MVGVAPVDGRLAVPVGQPAAGRVDRGRDRPECTGPLCAAVPGQRQARVEAGGPNGHLPGLPVGDVSLPVCVEEVEAGRHLLDALLEGLQVARAVDVEEGVNLTELAVAEDSLAAVHDTRRCGGCGNDGTVDGAPYGQVDGRAAAHVDRLHPSLEGQAGTVEAVPAAAVAERFDVSVGVVDGNGGRDRPGGVVGTADQH